MLVVADVDDIFIPRPTDLLVNLKEAHNALENLLTGVPEMFQNSMSTGSALGPALETGARLMVR